jgi:hypothetical protein
MDRRQAQKPEKIPETTMSDATLGARIKNLLQLRKDVENGANNVV